jgi:hypothetical protein
VVVRRDNESGEREEKRRERTRTRRRRDEGKEERNGVRDFIGQSGNLLSELVLKVGNIGIDTARSDCFGLDT